jgi:hypothetical protein
MDNNIINDSCKNIDLRNLINFSIYPDINKKNRVKNKKRLLKEMDPEPEIKNEISNLAKLNNDIKINIEKYIECYSNDKTQNNL